MITLTREEAQQVLDAMLKFGRPIADQVDEEVYYGAAETLRARLAQPDREWQWLTDEQVQKIEMSASSKLSAIYLAEAQLKGKNAL